MGFNFYVYIFCKTASDVIHSKNAVALDMSVISIKLVIAQIFDDKGEKGT